MGYENWMQKVREDLDNVKEKNNLEKWIYAQNLVQDLRSDNRAVR